MSRLISRSSAVNLMTRRYGIDTSVLVRLLTGQPPETYVYCERQLTTLVESGTQVCASNQVIGEAYIAVSAPLRCIRRTMPSQGCWTCSKAGWSPHWEGFRLSLPCRIQEGQDCSTGSSQTATPAPAWRHWTLDRKMTALPDVRRL